MDKIEVFRDLVLTGPAETRDAVAATLTADAADPWRFDAEGSADAGRNATGEEGVLLFERLPATGIPAARLVLWPQDDGYYVPNIVPTSVGQLTTLDYNAVLADFADTLARPVARRFGWSVGITSAQQGIDDWLAAEPSAALRRFSAAANKSTGASHPMDLLAVVRLHHRGPPDRRRLRDRPAGPLADGGGGLGRGDRSRPRGRIRTRYRAAPQRSRDPLTVTPADLRTIAEASIPTLCIDTCSLLDIMRDPTREDARPHERKAAIDLAGALEAGELACLVAEQVELEFQEHGAPIQAEAQDAIRRLVERVGRANAIHGVFAIPKAVASYGSVAETVVTHPAVLSPAETSAAPMKKRRSISIARSRIAESDNKRARMPGQWCNIYQC